MENSSVGIKLGAITHLKDRKVKITSKISGKALDICQKQSHGNKIGQLITYDYYGAQNQQFVVKQQGGDVILRNQASDSVLGVEGESHENGTPIVIGHNRNLSSQRWRFIKKDSQKDEYYIYCCHSGKVMDLCEGSNGNNKKVIQWEFHGKDNQLWIVTEI